VSSFTYRARAQVKECSMHWNWFPQYEHELGRCTSLPAEINCFMWNCAGINHNSVKWWDCPSAGTAACVRIGRVAAGWLLSFLEFNLVFSNRNTFFNYTVQLRHLQHTLTLIWTHIRKSYLYEYLRILSRQILKIDEVTTDVSLSAGTSPTTENTTL